MSNPQIDEWYELGRSNGALGGKLVGAGGGGFLMFYAEDHRRLEIGHGRAPASKRSASGSTSKARRCCSRESACRHPRRRAGHAPAAGDRDDSEGARRGGRPAVRRTSARLASRPGYRSRGVLRRVSWRDDSRSAGRRRRWNLSLDYVFDGQPLLGTGGALKRALPELGEAFFVLYGDSLSDVRPRRPSNGRLLASQCAGLMTVFRNDDRWDRSNVHFEDGRLLRYDKTHQTPDMRHIDYGLGVLTARALATFRPIARSTLHWSTSGCSPTAIWRLWRCPIASTRLDRRKVSRKHERFWRRRN